MKTGSFKHLIIYTFLSCASIAAPANALQGIGDDITIETSDFLQWTAWRNIRDLNPESSLSGAYGVLNRAWEEKKTRDRDAKWYIEEQRAGGDLIAGGIARHNTDAIDRGIKILHWGFDQQQPDGGFNSSDAYHSTSVFVESVAHALLMLRDSEYSDRYISVFKDLKPKLQLAAKWMLRADIVNQGKSSDAAYAHRRFIVAAALGEAGIYLNNQELIQRAQEYAAEGIKLQTDSGYYPERGGWDSHYQAIGMIFAERFYTIAASASLRPSLYSSIEKAASWEASRVLPDGTVDTSDNTRVGAGKKEKSRSGELKKVDAGKVARAFYYWSAISGDAKYKGLAQRIATNAQIWHEPK